MSAQRAIRVCIVLTMFGYGIQSLPAQESPGQEQPAAAAPGELRQALLGAWGPSDGLGVNGTVRIKFWGLKHWYVTEADPTTGQILFSHGGTYTLKGDEYEETVTFADASRMNMIGAKFNFKIEVEKDTYKQTGIGNPYDEQWKRLGVDESEADR